MDDLLPTALLFLFLGLFVFSWLDWHVRMRKVGPMEGPSWDCPHCGITNEAERAVCWSCSAATSGLGVWSRDYSPAADTWRCGRCGAWNGSARGSCWSCSNRPMKQPKRDA